ncbi:sugar nucleotide-binding protein [uncultured Paraburkholderia sp.]|uniref:SDR family oxidoreductase n=1 Tax=uncultured Paraburkholderia sp. TaxID=1822466 RepID=UPI002596D645|nr:sugar nucleotide-binding protein [uncultured Paraburkholderia sp.]
MKGHEAHQGTATPVMNVLIIGGGFVGQCLADELLSNGHRVALACRNRPQGLRHRDRWIQLDATDAVAFRKAVGRLRPSVVVLVNGPSDISECAKDPVEAARIHGAVARNACEFAPTAYKLLVSTDNVFDGRRTTCTEAVAPEPLNAYGRAKLAAERILHAYGGQFLIARTSLIYGWEEDQRGWQNFFALSIQRLAFAETLEVPDDLWNTPIAVADAAKIYRRCLEENVTGLLHVAGPQRISRLDWARLLAAEFGFDAGLIKAVPVQASRYFCRPRNSCLSSERLPAMLAQWHDVTCRSPAEVAADMKAGLGTQWHIRAPHLPQPMADKT